MVELAPDAVKAESFLPKAIALPLPEMLADGHADQFLFSVGESAFGAIVAVSQFGVGLAKLGLVLFGVGFAAGEVFLSLLAAVSFSGGGLFEA